MSLAGPYDRDPPWSDAPVGEPEVCPACGAACDVPGESERLTEYCGGCGFKWGEIAAAVKCVDAVARAIGAVADAGYIGEEKRRAAINAALGEMVAP
jgi:hypothetical protein